MTEKKTKVKAEQEKPMEKEQEQTAAEEERAGIEFPSRKNLEDQLTAAELKTQELEEQMLRFQAEMENLRKRTERDVSNARKFSNERLLIDLLPVVDSLTRGLEGEHAKQEDPHIKLMCEGIRLTLDLLEKTLSKHGVTVIEPLSGDSFDPARHEAMSAQPATDNAKPDTVISVLQKGYTLNGRILRPAMVIIAK